MLLIASTTRCLEAQKTAKKDGFTVAKLFARHMKLEEQAEDLRKRGSLIGIGTPERILKLAQEGHLKLEKTQLVILDGVPDAKGFTIVDGNTFVPCLDFLRAAFHGPTKAEGAKFIWLEDK